MCAPSTGGDDGVALRVQLLDEVLQMAQERGMVIYSAGMLVTMIESVLACPDYGPKLQRAQGNLELLLRQMDTPLEQPQILRLMSSYAYRANWDQFWDVFRSPTRHSQPRSADQHVLAYRLLAATGDRNMCLAALRWVYPEMIREEPPVLPVGDVYDALKQCLHVADPMAETLLLHGPDVQADTPSKQRQEGRRYQRREVLQLLREVEQINDEYVKLDKTAARQSGL